MNFKKHFIKKISLFLFIIVIVLTSLSFAEDEKKLSAIVCERINTMDEFYRQEISYIDAVERLSEIEKGRLLNNDIDNLLLFYQTDLERIDDYEISKIKITTKNDSIICAEMNILLKIQRLGDFYGTQNGTQNDKEEYHYNLIFEKCDKKLYLVQFIVM